MTEAMAYSIIFGCMFANIIVCLILEKLLGNPIDK